MRMSSMVWGFRMDFRWQGLSRHHEVRKDQFSYFLVAGRRVKGTGWADPEQLGVHIRNLLMR